MKTNTLERVQHSLGVVYQHCQINALMHVSIIFPEVKTPIDAPIGLKVSAINATCIRVSWAALHYGPYRRDHVVAYTVFYESTDGHQAGNFTTSPRVPGMVIVGLRPSTVYRVHVRALDNRGAWRRSPMMFVRTADQGEMVYACLKTCAMSSES